uniref:Uncharacterized protein n=1 Tax=Babesia bovis TaxID=5865 RepID=S6C8K5_BABBO|nr:hypothetical protein [Babesia bovis]
MHRVVIIRNALPSRGSPLCTRRFSDRLRSRELPNSNSIPCCDSDLCSTLRRSSTGGGCLLSSAEVGKRSEIFVATLTLARSMNSSTIRFVSYNTYFCIFRTSVNSYSNLTSGDSSSTAPLSNLWHAISCDVSNP